MVVGHVVHGGVGWVGSGDSVLFFGFTVTPGPQRYSMGGSAGGAEEYRREVGR